MDMRKVIILAVGILVIGAGLNIFFNIRDMLVDTEDEITLSEDFKNIEILVENASVNIYPSSDTTTTVRYEGKMKNNRFSAEVRKDTLQVELTSRSWSNIGINFTPFSNKLDIYVPEKAYEIIQADSNNGALRAENMEADEIRMETNNGRIYLKQVTSNTIQANTDNGRIMLEEVESDIEARTYNGRIELLSSSLDHDIDLNTNNGKILIDTDEQPTNATIDVDTDNGKIDVYGNYNKHTVFGEGKNKVKIETDNGSVTIK